MFVTRVMPFYLFNFLEIFPRLFARGGEARADRPASASEAVEVTYLRSLPG